MDKNKVEFRPNHRTGRRSVLKLLGIVAGTTFGTTTISSAKESDLYLGETHFVEAYVEHPDAPDLVTAVRCGRADYVPDVGSHRITLTEAPVNTFEINTGVFTIGRRYGPLEGTVPLNTSDKSIAQRANYRQLGAQYLKLATPTTHPSMHVSQNNEHVEVSSTNKKIKVEPGETVSTDLQRRSVEFERPRDADESGEHSRKTTDQRGPPSIVEEVQPNLTVRNHGQIEVYGGDDVVVLPLNSSDPYAQSRVAAARRVLDDPTIDEEDELLIISNKSKKN